MTRDRQALPSMSGSSMSGLAQDLVRRAASLSVDAPLGAHERVWRRVASRRASRRRAPLYFAFTACAAAAALLWALFPRSPDELAVVIRGNGMRRALNAGEATAPLAELALADLHAAGQLVVGRDTVARLDRLPNDGLMVRLERGTLLIHVRPRGGRAPFVVRTPRFDVKVVGTILRVTVGADGDGVAVGHGLVEVTPTGGAPVRIAAGEHWPAAVANVPSPDELERLGATELEGVTAASFVPKEAVSSCNGTATEVLICRLRAVRATEGPAAEAELYQLGELAARSFGDRSRALAIWREERGRFPGGALAQEVDESIIDSLVALHRSAEAEREIVAYLSAHPHSARAPEMHFVVGTLFRELDGDCRRAAAELDRALATPAAPWSEQARTARRACTVSTTSTRR
jgi:hypothetical protein